MYKILKVILIKMVKKTAKYCSPDREDNNYTCFTLENLKDIARAYNKKYSGGNKIKINGKSRKKLWEEIREKLSSECNNEVCIAKKYNNNKKIVDEAFRPEMPEEWKKDMTTWLSTDDINNVMRQYERKYPDFIFLGTVPLDCGINSELQCELTRFDIEKMYKMGKTKFATVYNLSKSYEPGTHWVCVNIAIKPNKENRKNGKIIANYYDSFGGKSPKEIQRTIQLVEESAADSKLLRNYQIENNYNRVRHQYDSYNCGVFCMWFIIESLKGKTIRQIENMRPSLEKMQKCKSEWYRDAF